MSSDTTGSRAGVDASGAAHDRLQRLADKARQTLNVDVVCILAPDGKQWLQICATDGSQASNRLTKHVLGLARREITGDGDPDNPPPPGPPQGFFEFLPLNGLNTEGGTVGIADRNARDLSASEQDTFGNLARAADGLLAELRVRRAEEREQASESRYAAVLEAMVDGVITIDIYGTVQSMNRAATRIFGYKPEEIIGQNVSRLMPRALGLEHDQHVSRYLETGRANIIGIGREVMGLRADGTEIPIDLAVSETAVGSDRVFTGIIRDISERKRAEEQIKSLNAALEQRVDERTRQLEIANRSLAAEAADRTALAEIARIITSSPHVGDVFSEFAGQVRNLVDFDRISICSIDPGKRELKETFAADRSGDQAAADTAFPLSGTAGERMLKSRSGLIVADAPMDRLLKRFPCHASLFKSARSAAAMGAPVIAADRVIGLLSVSSLKPGAYSEADLTMLELIGRQIGAPIENSRLYEQEAALRDAAETARARLEGILRVSAAGVLIVDAEDGRVLLATEEATRIAGSPINPGDTQGYYEEIVVYRRPDGVLLAPDELPLQRAITAGEVVREMEVVFERPNGTRVPTLVSAAPVLAPDGQVTAGIAVFQDITGLKELDEVKADFLSMITHDLRGPLASIKGLAAAAMAHVRDGGNDGDMLLEDLRAVDDETDRLTELVSNLLDMSRIEAGAVPIEPEESHMADLAGDAVRRAARTRLGEGREVTADAPLDLPLVYVDPDQIGRVLDNLVSNALKYSDGPVRVRARYDAERDAVLTVVEDRGIGVPPEVRSEIFEKFFRVTDAGRQAGMGAGLGLAICKAIVEAHGGEIWVEGEPGRGSRFWFSLPAPGQR